MLKEILDKMGNFASLLCYDVAKRAVQGGAELTLLQADKGGSPTITTTTTQQRRGQPQPQPQPQGSHKWPEGVGRTTGYARTPDYGLYSDAARACVEYLLQDPMHELLTKLCLYLRYKYGFTYALERAPTPGTYSFHNDNKDIVDLVVTLDCVLPADRHGVEITTGYVIRARAGMSGGTNTSTDVLKQGAWLVLGTATMVLPAIGLIIAFRMQRQSYRMNILNNASSTIDKVYCKTVLNHYKSDIDIQALKSWFDVKKATSAACRQQLRKVAQSVALHEMRTRVVEKLQNLTELNAVWDARYLFIVDNEDVDVRKMVTHEVVEKTKSIIGSKESWADFYSPDNTVTALMQTLYRWLDVHARPRLHTIYVDRIKQAVATRLLYISKRDLDGLPSFDDKKNYIEEKRRNHSYAFHWIDTQLARRLQELVNSKPPTVVQDSVLPLLKDYYKLPEEVPIMNEGALPNDNNDILKKVVCKVLGLITKHVLTDNTDEFRNHVASYPDDNMPQVPCCCIGSYCVSIDRGLHLAEVLYIAPVYCCVYCFEATIRTIKKKENTSRAFPFLVDEENKVKQILCVSDDEFKGEHLTDDGKAAVTKLKDNIIRSTGGSVGGIGRNPLVAAGLLAAITVVAACTPR